MTSLAFTQNPVNNTPQTVGVQFQHTGSSGSKWYSYIWTNPRNTPNITAQCASIGIDNYSNCLNTSIVSDSTEATITISNPPNFNFNNNMQIMNLSSQKLLLTTESSSNCSYTNGNLQSTILSGVLSQVYNVNIMTSNLSSTGTFGQCAINVTNNSVT